MLNKYIIRKQGTAFFPWVVMTPGGTLHFQPTFEHAIDVVDHLLGHHHARRRAEQKG
ncbi:hypothetical protein ACFYU5_18815 [Nocardia aobensis]|uniref:Uncharacterized protein n=1 Tax=Nocardia aobensis TaxID=257277 RepID=A0ABW6P5N7_9NOCA